MSNDDFRRELNSVLDDVSGSPSSGLRDRVRSAVAQAPEARAPYWIAGVAAVVIAVLIVGVLFVANPFKRPSSVGGVLPTPSATPTETPTASPSAEPSPSPFVCSTQDFIANSGTQQNPVIYASAMRTGSHVTYDRLTIEFANGVPADVKITTGSGTSYTLSPSGLPTTVKGQNHVTIVMHGADLHTSYSGSTDIVTGYNGLAEVKVIEDFEGVVQLGLGVNGSPCYHAFFLTNPNRLVIDVQTPA